MVCARARIASFIIALTTLALGACAAAPAAHDAAMATIVVEAHVPADAGPVYLTGNQASLGPWNPAATPMRGAGEVRTASVRVPFGETFEFKVTLGSWDREGLGPSGAVMPNSTHLVSGDARVRIDVVDFKKDVLEYIADWRGSGVLGRLDYWTNVSSQFLDLPRHVEIWLPPDYDAEPNAHFPVLYMQDGQNLFDPRIANTGVDWGVDEAVMDLVEQSVIPPVIVVGVWNTSKRRFEYAPEKVLTFVQGEARSRAGNEFTELLGDEYVRFLVEELKPRVDAAYRTAPERDCTAVMGSSMGAIISFYAMAERPDVFGGAAGLSFHWPIGVNSANIFEHADIWRPAIAEAYARYIAASRLAPAQNRLWADHGDVGLDSLYAPYQEALVPVFENAGYEQGQSLAARVYPGTEHSERAWRARLRDPLTFLFHDREACHH